LCIEVLTKLNREYDVNEDSDNPEEHYIYFNSNVLTDSLIEAKRLYDLIWKDRKGRINQSSILR